MDEVVLLFLLPWDPFGFYKFLEYCIDRYIVSSYSSGLKSFAELRFQQWNVDRVNN